MSRYDWSLQVSDVIIQTNETARQVFFLDTFVTHERPLLLVGPTGTGKSAITNNYLVGLPKEKYVHQDGFVVACIRSMGNKQE